MLKLAEANCYLKNSYVPADFHITTDEPLVYNGALAHSAIVSVANGSSLPYECESQQNMKSSSNETTYFLHCSPNQKGNAGSKQHEEILRGYLDAFDAYNATHDGNVSL
jgi:hypothetical protein